MSEQAGSRPDSGRLTRGAFPRMPLKASEENGAQSIEDSTQEILWRSNGAMFIVMKSAAEVARYLSAMLREKRKTDPLLDEHFDKWGPDHQSDDALDGFSEIMGSTWQLEISIRCATDTAILMAAIDLESTINQFCFYNLGEPTADAIERLSLTEKIEVAHRAMGLQQFKGTKPYECVRELANWRNAFAHGKTPGIPHRSLRESHLMPKTEIGVSIEPDVKQMAKLVSGYILAERYLSRVGQHPATNFHKLDLDDIEEWINRIKSYRFAQGFLEGKARRRNVQVMRDPFYRL